MNSFTDGSEHDSGQDETSHDSAAAGAAGSRSLRRPASGRVVAGVAAAIATYFNIDVTIVRVGFAVLTVVGFTGLAYLGSIPLYLAGIPLYLTCWLLIPEEGSEHSIVGRLFASRQHRPG